MKAKCPYCTDGCPSCESGWMEVRFASGDVFTRYCPDCGFENGGRVAAYGLPDPGPCVQCNGTNVEWALVFTLEEGEEP